MEGQTLSVPTITISDLVTVSMIVDNKNVTYKTWNSRHSTVHKTLYLLTVAPSLLLNRKKPGLVHLKTEVLTVF